MKQSYLAWLAAETESEWNNDSAVLNQVRNAVELGAIGMTSNPPLSYEALTTDAALFSKSLAGLDKSLPDDEFAFRAMSLVVAHYAGFFREMHGRRGGFFGCVRAQVAPNARFDAGEMLDKGQRLAALGENVMVKIPGTKAGMLVLEELAALGIPTNPTVVTTVAQAVAAAEANERGASRAERAGVKPAWSSCAIVMGRAQDYFASLNQERHLGLATLDLEWAALAIVKRSQDIYAKKGYRSRIMPAAYRSAMQVEQLSGGPYHSTIHPKIQKLVEETDAAGGMRREKLFDRPVDLAAVKRVTDVLPEAAKSIEPDALSHDEFDRFGSVTMTLDAFDVTGWQKLVGLKRG